MVPIGKPAGSGLSEMAGELTPDICIIGGGPGGLAAAAAAASAGAKVVLIERGRLGGNNLVTGSIPSKALLASAAVYEALRSGPRFGVTGAPLQVDLVRARQHIGQATEGVAAGLTPERLAALGITVIAGEARFASPELIAVETTAIRARHVIIATGGAPAMPDIPGLDGAEALTFADAFELTRHPSHLVVLGGGPYALELAQAYNRLGMDATVISETPFLPDFDPEHAAIVTDRLRAEGVGLRVAKVTLIARRRSGLRLTLDDAGEGEAGFDASHLLVATGRMPDVERLGLAAGGIASTADGITVDRNFRTSNPRVRAIGDAIAGPALVERARGEGEAVVRSILRRVPAGKARTIPAAAFTDPGLAAVGMSEPEARLHHRSIRVYRFPIGDSDRAHIEHDRTGALKVIATVGGRRVVGASIVGRGAAELIAPWTLAVTNRLPLAAMESLVAAYPTRSEIDRRLVIPEAGGLQSLGLTSGIGSLTEEWAKRIIVAIRGRGRAL